MSTYYENSYLHLISVLIMFDTIDVFRKTMLCSVVYIADFWFRTNNKTRGQTFSTSFLVENYSSETGML